MGGKLAGQIVSGIFSGGGHNKPSGSQQHNYTGQQSQNSHGGGSGGGLVGSLIGGAAGMFGGTHNQQVCDAKTASI
jgi:hypothetical protein